jgi:CheY-like chemotaxis protein
VTDTGCGMPPDVAMRAFDPFFTTKEVGKGTGLGLSQVYGMARQAGGTVRLASAPGEGTVVRILLRATELDARQQAGAAKEKVETAAQATVLIVDDDPDVRQFLTDSLDTFGYKTIAAADGAAGLDILDRMRPDLLIVDYAMPGMTGAQLASQARTKHPGLPILFASGYAETSALETALDGKALVLRKPFRLDVLQAAIAKAMRSA